MESDSPTDSDPGDRQQPGGSGEPRSRSSLEQGRAALVEVFTREQPQTELKRLLVVSALVGITLGIAGYFTAEMFANTAEAGGDELVASGIAAGTFGALIHMIALVAFAFIGPVLTVVLCQELPHRLYGEPGRTQYLLGLIGGYVGHLGLILLAFFILSQHPLIGAGGGSGGGLFGGAALIALASAVAGVAGVYVTRLYGVASPPGGSPPVSD